MQSLLTFEFLCFKHNSYTRYTVDTLTYINNNLFSTKQFNKFLYTCIVKFRFLLNTIIHCIFLKVSNICMDFISCLNYS